MPPVPACSLGRTNLNVSLLGLGSGGANRLGQAHSAAPADVYRRVRNALRNVMPLAAEKKAGLVAMCAVRTIIVNPELLRETIRQWKDDGALAEDAVSDDNPLDWVLCDGVESRACRVESVLLHAFRRRG